MVDNKPDSVITRFRGADLRSLHKSNAFAGYLGESAFMISRKYGVWAMRYRPDSVEALEDSQRC